MAPVSASHSVKHFGSSQLVAKIKVGQQPGLMGNVRRSNQYILK